MRIPCATGPGRGRARLATIAIATAALLATAASPALAATCIQVTGEGVSLFFQFKGKLPTQPNSLVPVNGRINGAGPAYGAASVPVDGSFVEIAGGFASGGTFFGLFNIGFAPPKSKTGGGGVVIDGLVIPVEAKIVSCRKEPKPK